MQPSQAECRVVYSDWLALMKRPAGEPQRKPPPVEPPSALIDNALTNEWNSFLALAEKVGCEEDFRNALKSESKDDKFLTSDRRDQLLNFLCAIQIVRNQRSPTCPIKLFKHQDAAIEGAGQFGELAFKISYGSLEVCATTLTKWAADLVNGSLGEAHMFEVKDPGTSKRKWSGSLDHPTGPECQNSLVRPTSFEIKNKESDTVIRKAKCEYC